MSRTRVDECLRQILALVTGNDARDCLKAIEALDEKEKAELRRRMASHPRHCRYLRFARDNPVYYE